MMYWNSAGEDFHFSAIGVWYLLIDRDSPGKTEHNNFEVRQGRTPWLFILVSRSEAIFLIVCPVLHTIVLYLISSKKNLSALLLLEEVTIPTYFIFIRYGYLQHGGYSYGSSHSL